jgi:hypothetical protein
LKTGEMPGTIHKAIMRFRGKERAQDRIHSDEMKKMRDRLGLKSESFSKLSKTAQFIKTIYQEAMYDHEKEDKSIQTYGKKPKMEKGDDKENMGEKKPEARATLTGGTTLTGEKRDMIELDPMMRNRPGQPDLTKKKDDKKDGGKEDKKKDK